MKAFWNKRYSEEEYVYGALPNIFFSNQLTTLQPGAIILACEGEGRNAVYAAKLGWKVKAFDFSESAKEKAERLATEEQVDINYRIDNIVDVNYSAETADVVALIFSHFAEIERKLLHQKAIKWLKPGGKLILEAFNPKQIHNTSGGPKDKNMLYTLDSLKQDFNSLQIDVLELAETNLNEGEYHQGKADVIRLIATKKQ